MARILLVERYPSLRNIVSEILIGVGHQVTAYETVAEGRQAEAESENSYDLLITDTGAIGTTEGLYWALELKNADPHQRVIVLSTYTIEDLPQSAGMDALIFLQKPFDNDDLLMIVRSELNS